MLAVSKRKYRGKGGPRVLCEDRVAVGGFTVTYRLFEAGREPSRYVVLLSTDEERQAAPLGEELTFALEVYRALVRGGVTPCTLLDVTEDFFEGGLPDPPCMENFAESLYKR